MKTLLTKLSSRKFLTALAVQIVAVVAIFAPQQEQAMTDAAMRITGLVVLLLAALGYGAVEASVDKARAGGDEPPQ